MLTSAFIATAALPAPVAFAASGGGYRTTDGFEAVNHRKIRKRHRRAHRRSHRRGHRRHRHDDDIGGAIAAGIIGLAIGAIIADHNDRREDRVRRYEYDDPVRISPREPLYDDYDGETDYRQYRSENRSVERKPLTDSTGPQVITYEETASLEPWSTGWFDYCTSRYRSFNRQSGTFLGYDGKRHFCVPK